MRSLFHVYIRAPIDQPLSWESVASLFS